jgi:hypothetical protein
MQILYSFNSYFFSKTLKARGIIRGNSLHLHTLHSTLLFAYVLYSFLFAVWSIYSLLWSYKCRPSSQNGSTRATKTATRQPITGPDVFAAIILSWNEQTIPRYCYRHTSTGYCYLANTTLVGQKYPQSVKIPARSFC